MIREFRVRIEGLVYAEDIDGVLTLLATHFADPIDADDADVVQISASIRPTDASEQVT